MNQYYTQLLPYLERNHAYEAALALLSWDTETLAPPAASENTAKYVGILSEEAYHILICDEVESLLKKLSSKKEQETLSVSEQAVVRLLQKQFKKLSCIPPKEYREFSELCATAQTVYCRAKQNAKFEDFAPTLEKLVDYTRRFASYRAEKNDNLYDLLLDEYEEGFTTDILDDFFAKLREAIVPLMKQVIAKNDTIKKDYNTRNYPEDIQEGFCRFLSGYLGFDYNRGVIAESEHPFTTSLHNHDVRITNHYYSDNLESAMFSAIHETGHALYEMGVDDTLSGTPAGTGISMGMHESQSRFYENMIGRSKEFWEPLFPKLKATYPEELADVSLENFIAGINKAEPGPIRTEADELTYPLHIMIRYELEKDLIAGNCTVSDLPELWNKKYKDYLGITPKNASEGVLQDIHWSGASFGYFPSYALGSAIAAQLYHYMAQQIPVTDYLKEGNMVPIREFLRDHIHKYGAVYPTNELLKKVTGEEFNPDYYIRYLTEKYTKLYHL
ncbi:MAG: carboxypeptidase M32 [Lachnospiraceae bacterium]|nr:carboxypeptidase M32 [Lachnospiraceae bacterium]